MRQTTLPSMAIGPFALLSRWWHSPRIRYRILLWIGALVLFMASLLVGAWFRVCAGGACPSISQLVTYDPDQASKVYAADGRLVTDLGLQRRTVVPLSQISPAVIAAFLATEDRRFYQHHGVDWVRVLGALRSIGLRGRLEDFSTITMQLAGNLCPEEINRWERHGW